MNSDDLRRRLAKDRPMVSISLRVPEDVLADLKRVAPALGFSGYQPLMKAYIGQGLRADLARRELPGSVERFAASLRQRGVDQQVIDEALLALE